MAEELNFHLFEFAGTEREIPGCNLISKTFANLCDAKRNTNTSTINHVLKVDEDPLCRFRTKVRRAFFAGKRSDECLEHQIEFARLR